MPPPRTPKPRTPRKRNASGSKKTASQIDVIYFSHFNRTPF
jgi:hypothetical protein